MIPLCRFPRNCLSLEKFHILEGDSQPDLDIGQNGCLFSSSSRQESSDRIIGDVRTLRVGLGYMGGIPVWRGVGIIF